MCFSTTNKTVLPKPTAAEIEMQKLYAAYAGKSAMPLATRASVLANTGMGQVPNVNYNGMYNTMQGGIATQQQNQNKLQQFANQAYTDASLGNVANNLQNQRFNYINAPMQQAQKQFSAGLSSLGNSGTINSSLLRNMNNDISQNAVNTIGNNLSDAYSTDYGLSVDSANNRISNQSNLINQGMNTAYAPIQYAGATQENALAVPSTWASLALGQAAPALNLSSSLAQIRGMQPTTTSSGTSGLGTIIGTGLGMLACFPADTMIATPDGDKPIQDVMVGDTVSTLTGEQKVTKTIQSLQPLITIETDKGNLQCTVTEVLLSVEGSLCVEDMMVGDILIHKDGGATVTGIKVGLEIVPVYEIVVPYFYADGFVVDGFDPMEV